MQEPLWEALCSYHQPVQLTALWSPHRPCALNPCRASWPGVRDACSQETFGPQL